MAAEEGIDLKQAADWAIADIADIAAVVLKQLRLHVEMFSE